MPHPANIQSNLKSQFDKIDNMYLNDDLRVFGRDTDRIFKQVDIIRRKQIELATEHIGLDNMEDTSLPVSDDIDDEYKRNLLYFSKKEIALKSLMGKLDTLGEIMNKFRETNEFNPHTTDTETVVQSSRKKRSDSCSNSSNERAPVIILPEASHVFY